MFRNVFNDLSVAQQDPLFKNLSIPKRYLGGSDSEDDFPIRIHCKAAVKIPVAEETLSDASLNKDVANVETDSSGSDTIPYGVEEGDEDRKFRIKKTAKSTKLSERL